MEKIQLGGYFLALHGRHYRSHHDGLVLMLTPRTGSQRVVTPLSWLSKDFYALKPHGELVTDLHGTLVNNRVVLDETHGRSWARPAIESISWAVSVKSYPDFYIE